MAARTESIPLSAVEVSRPGFRHAGRVRWTGAQRGQRAMRVRVGPTLGAQTEPSVFRFISLRLQLEAEAHLPGWVIVYFDESGLRMTRIPPHLLTRLPMRETSIAPRHFRFRVRVSSIADRDPLARHMVGSKVRPSPEPGHRSVWKSNEAIVRRSSGPRHGEDAKSGFIAKVAMGPRLIALEASSWLMAGLPRSERSNKHLVMAAEEESKRSSITAQETIVSCRARRRHSCYRCSPGRSQRCEVPHRSRWV